MNDGQGCHLALRTARKRQDAVRVDLRAGRNQVLAADPAPVSGQHVHKAAQMARLAAADPPSS